MFNKKILVSLIALGLLSGCSMAPKYERPDMPVPENYPAQSKSQIKDKWDMAAHEIKWRDFFQDERLNMLIEAALEHNRDLRVAALRVDEARSMYNIQWSERLPTIGIGADGSRGRVPGDLNSTGVSRISSSYAVGAALASFELDLWGRVKSLSDAALETYLASEEAKRAAQITIICEVAKAYLAERAYTEQFELAQKSYQTRKESYNLAKKRFEVGASSALDLAQYESLMESALVSMNSLLRERAQAQNALDVLVGTKVENLPAPRSLLEYEDSNIVKEIPEGLPSELLINRPDILQAEHQLKAANANIGAARAAFFPSISLTGMYGSSSSRLSQLFHGGQKAWSFAPQLFMPVFDAGRNINNLDLAWTRKHISVAEYEKTIQNAFREVADALIARDLLTEQVRAQESVMKAEAQRYKLSDARYKAGVANSLEVLDAQRQLFAAEQSLVQVRLLRLTNSIDLYRALGGGFVELKENDEKKKDKNEEQEIVSQEKEGADFN